MSKAEEEACNSELRNSARPSTNAMMQSPTHPGYSPLLYGVFKFERARGLSYTDLPCIGLIDKTEFQLKTNVDAQTVERLQYDDCVGMYPTSSRNVSSVLDDVYLLRKVCMIQSRCLRMPSCDGFHFVVVELNFWIHVIRDCDRYLSKTESAALARVLAWGSNDWSTYDLLESEAASRCVSLDIASKKLTSVSELYPLNQSVKRLSVHELGSASLPLPGDIFRKIFFYLEPSSLHQASCTCRCARELSFGIIPGLKLTLFSHQFTSVWWMIARESGHSASAHPAWRSLRWKDHALNKDVGTVCGDLITGNLTFEALPMIRDISGGLLCDEPGLGKTITLLAVILRKLGRRCGKNGNTGSHNNSYIMPANRSHGLLSEPNVSNDTDVGVSITSPASTRTYQYSLRGGSERGMDTEKYAVHSKASNTTLIVVPEVLKAQWRDQIDKYVSTSVLNAGNVFIDEDESAPLPDADVLCEKAIVVVTHRRLAIEWKTGKPNFYHHKLRNALSPLLQVYFYRVAFDEGHQMGRANITDSLCMATSLLARCRWLLTGTPTPSDLAQSREYIYRQLRFLQHPLFAEDTPETSRLWRRIVSGAFGQGALAETVVGAPVLKNLLERNMIRHTKESIAEIPKPTFRTTKVRMGHTEAVAYNSLVALAKTNLVICGLDYTQRLGQHEDSLLNPRNKASLQEFIKNLRTATCGAGSIRLVLPKTNESIQEIVDIFHRTGVTEERIIKIKNYCYRALEGVKTPCEKCRLCLEMLLVTPCACLYCPDCMGSLGDYCELCCKYFDWNELQKLQPGLEASPFLFQGSAMVQKERSNVRSPGAAMTVPLRNIDRSTSHRNQSSPNPTMRRVTASVLGSPFLQVPVSSSSSPSSSTLFHPSPSSALPFSPPSGIHSATLNENMHGQGIDRSAEYFEPLKSAKIDYLMSQVEALEVSFHGHLNSVRAHSVSSQSIIDEDLQTTTPQSGSKKRKITFGSGGEDEQSQPKHSQHQQAHFASQYTSPGCTSLLSTPTRKRSSKSSLFVIPKVVVFSQFTSFLDRLVIELNERGIGYADVGFGNATLKAKEINRFRVLPGVRVLLLSTDGSHGLDLSFVTHIFLMDSIFNASLEQQVISRAYRMGARQSVIVDQIYTEGTVDEHMHVMRIIEGNAYGSHANAHADILQGGEEMTVDNNGHSVGPLTTSSSSASASSSSSQPVRDRELIPRPGFDIRTYQFTAPAGHSNGDLSGKGSKGKHDGLRESAEMPKKRKNRKVVKPHMDFTTATTNGTNEVFVAKKLQTLLVKAEMLPQGLEYDH